MLTLSINATCILLCLSKAIYIYIYLCVCVCVCMYVCVCVYIYVECINLSAQELFLGELFQALISLARD
jgi:hypothetical protein